MFPSGNLIGFRNGQPVYQQQNIQSDPINLQIPQATNNQLQWQPTMMKQPENAMNMNMPTMQQQYHTTPIQTVNTNQFSSQPVQQQMPTSSKNSANIEDRETHYMTSTSEDEEENQTNSKNAWQVMGSNKRKKIHNNKPNPSEIETGNRFQPLSKETEENIGNVETNKIPKPPPIFVHGVQDFKEMTKQLEEIAKKEEYQTKSLINNVVKINCETPEIYRKLVKEFKEKNIYHHTYQLKEERAYRIVIRYLHHSTNTDDIKSELSQLGHKVRNIVNVKQQKTKEPLNLFFVDLEPAQNNKDVYNITGLQNRVVHIEPPRTQKNSIIQCMRCQQYGHSKSYCNKPYVCVKCGGSHNTTTCKKSKETPAICALCNGGHPANYKGCDHYKKLTKGSNKNNGEHQNPSAIYTNDIYTRNTQQLSNPLPQGMSYAEVTKRNQTEDTTTVLNKFLEEFKNLFNQLIQQNSMVLNMLTMLMNKMK